MNKTPTDNLQKNNIQSEEAKEHKLIHRKTSIVQRTSSRIKQKIKKLDIFDTLSPLSSLHKSDISEVSQLYLTLKWLNVTDPELIQALSSLQPVYKNNKELFKEVCIALKANNLLKADVIESLSLVQPMYNSDIQKFKNICTALSLYKFDSAAHLNALVMFRHIYNNDYKQFLEFCSILNQKHIYIYPSDIVKLTDFNCLYNSLDQFEKTYFILQKYNLISFYTLQSLIELQSLFSTPKQLEEFCSILKTYNLDHLAGLQILAALESEYSGDIQKFKNICLEIKTKYFNSTYSLSKLSSFYSNLETLDQAYRITQNTKVFSYDVTGYNLFKLKDLYNQDLDELEEVCLTLAVNSLDRCIDKVCLLQPLFTQNKDQFKDLCETLKKYNFTSAEEIENLSKLHVLYKNNIKLFKQVCRILETYNLKGTDLETIVSAQSLFKDNLNTFEEVCKYAVRVKHIFGEKLPPSIFKKYIQLELEQEGKGDEYINVIKEKSFQYISSIPLSEDERNSNLYLDTLIYTYPKGDYSNHEDNLSNSTDQAHVTDQYKFNREGYSAQFSNLLGYSLKEGEVENKDLIPEFYSRLQEIDTRVQSKTLSTQVEQLFSKINNPLWIQIASSLEDKILILLLNEVLRKAETPANKYTPNIEVIDILLSYHCLELEDPQPYTSRLNNHTLLQADTSTQDAFILRSLTDIYGEDLTHTISSELLVQPKASLIYQEAQTQLSNILNQDSHRAKQESKAQNKLEHSISSLLSNPRISSSQYSQAISKPVQRYITSNTDLTPTQRQNIYIQIQNFLDQLDYAQPVSNLIEQITSYAQKERHLHKHSLDNYIRHFTEIDYQKIQEEFNKYEEVIEHKGISTKTRKVRGFFTKTKEASNARMSAFLCIADSHDMWTDNNYFEFVLQDEETGKCMGTVMLLNVLADDGKRYLWFGPNPSESLLSKVSDKDCFNFLYNTIANFAEENNFAGLIIPEDPNEVAEACTNRTGQFLYLLNSSRLRDENKQYITIPCYYILNKTKFYHHYQNGALIWQNPSYSTQLESRKSDTITTSKTPKKSLIDDIYIKSKTAISLFKRLF